VFADSSWSIDFNVLILKNYDQIKLGKMKNWKDWCWWKLFDIFYYSWYFNLGGGGIAGNESGLVVTECIGIDERFLSIADGGGVGWGYSKRMMQDQQLINTFLILVSLKGGCHDK